MCDCDDWLTVMESDLYEDDIVQRVVTSVNWMFDESEHTRDNIMIKENP